MIRTTSTCVLTLLVVACGAGISDRDYPIASGYYLSDAGGNNKMIIFKGATMAESSIVIDARVDKYVVDGSKIIVARRPWLPVERKNGAMSAELSPECQYWVINRETKAVTQLKSNNRHPDVRCE